MFSQLLRCRDDSLGLALIEISALKGKIEFVPHYV